MSREIKFRAWSDLHNIRPARMVYLDPKESGASLRDLVSEQGWTVMQFTGFKDKNGVEIYEGDIVEFDQREWGGNDNIHVVSWDDADGRWLWGGGSSDDMRWRKVIGNIYQNPDLLARAA